MSTSDRSDTPPVVRLADLKLDLQQAGSVFEALTAPVSAPRGAERLGCRLVVVPPGKRAWPFHNHHANDELFVVLSGRGKLRFGEALHAIEAGDVAVCPAGGRSTAHQIINDSDAELRYLAVSTMLAPDVMEYPDSGKVGVFAGAAPGGDKARRTLAMFVPAAAAVDYWDGEG